MAHPVRRTVGLSVMPETVGPAGEPHPRTDRGSVEVCLCGFEKARPGIGVELVGLGIFQEEATPLVEQIIVQPVAPVGKKLQRRDRFGSMEMDDACVGIRPRPVRFPVVFR